MAKLFAMEDADLEGGEGGSVDDTGNDAAVVETEMADDSAEISQGTDNVAVGQDAAEDLTKVKEAVEEDVAADVPLSEESAKYVRLAIEAISARVGYNPTNMYALYSTENFRSESSRMANTRIALEGIGEFLSKIWERIKAAVNWVVKKVKDFYAKHMSGLGRVIKALEAMKVKLGGLKGVIKNNRIKTPGSMRSAFPTDGTLSKAVIDKYIKAQDDETKGISTGLLHDTVNVVTAWAGSLKRDDKATFDANTNIKINDKNPGVGGIYWKFEKDATDYKFTVTREVSETKTPDDTELTISGKGDLQALVNSCIAIMKITKGFDKVVEKFSKEFNAAINALQTKSDTVKASMGTTDAHKENVSNLVNAINSLSTINLNYVKDLTVLNVKLSNAVITYCKICISEHKAS